MLTNLRVAITLVLALPLVVATGSFDNCPSCQIGTLGHAATIECSIGSNFSNGVWYTSSDTLLVCYEVENRSEHQSENDDYSIESDGSLRINNVSLHHPTVYRVVFYDDENHIHKKRIRFLVNRECSYSKDLERRKEDLEREKQREKERKRLMRLLRKEKKMKKKEQQKRRRERVKQKREKTRAKKQERKRI